MLQISRLFIYPVKSLGGISVDSALLTDRGFQYDRRWLLVDEQNRFMTQREYPKMTMLQTGIAPDGITIFHKNDIHERLLVPFYPETDNQATVTIWDDQCEAIVMDDSINKWISDRLQFNCRLVFMPDETKRKVDARYAVQEDNITNFSDAYPLLVISQASLDDLNSRMEKPLPMNRFRPNIVIAGANPYEEDEMEVFTIRGITFHGVKLCARCVMPTINQETMEKSKEPTKTLASYRALENKILFGQNVIYTSGGVSLKTGDRIEINRRKTSLFGAK